MVHFKPHSFTFKRRSNPVPFIQSPRLNHSSHSSIPFHTPIPSQPTAGNKKKQARSPLSAFAPARIPAPARKNHSPTPPAFNISHPKRITAESAISPPPPQASWTAPAPAGGDKPMRVAQPQSTRPKTVLKPFGALQTLDATNPLPRIRKNA